MAYNLVFDPFPDLVGPFWGLWWPFWILRPLIGRTFLIEGVLRSKNLFSEKGSKWADPVGNFFGPLAAILDFAGGSMFLLEQVLGSKNLFSKGLSERPIT